MVFMGITGLVIAQDAPAPAPAAATYLGADKCKMCHSKQHATWMKMKHWKITLPYSENHFIATNALLKFC